MLASLPEVKRKQFLYGDWDVVEEGAFPEFDKTVHTCESFEIPRAGRELEQPTSDTHHSAVLWGLLILMVVCGYIESCTLTV